MACTDTLDAYDLAYDPASEITVDNLSEAETMRDALIDYIWSGAGLPTGEGTFFAVFGTPATRLTTWRNVKEVRLRTFDAGNADATMYVRILVPYHATNNIAIAHQGHTSFEGIGMNAAVQLALDAGYTVIECSMPLYGDNSDTEYATHNEMEALEDPGVYSAIRPFLEGAVLGLNYVINNLIADPDNVVAFGVSGGGWTLGVLPAVDWRITCAISIAGTMPQYLRGSPCANVNEDPASDFEQGHTELLAVAGDLDQYICCAAGGRRYLQLYTINDPVIGQGPRYTTFQSIMETKAAACGGFYLSDSDPTETTHAIHASHRDYIEAELGYDAYFQTELNGSEATRSGSWTALSQGFESGDYFSASGSGSDTATYTFTSLTPGTYQIRGSWSEHSNRATNTPYEIYDDTTLLTTFTANQETANSGVKDSADTGTGEFKGWTVLGTVTISSTTLKVVITDNANEFVIAGGVRISRLGDALEEDIVLPVLESSMFTGGLQVLGAY